MWDGFLVVIIFIVKLVLTILFPLIFFRPCGKLLFPVFMIFSLSLPWLKTFH